MEDANAPETAGAALYVTYAFGEDKAAPAVHSSLKKAFVAATASLPTGMVKTVGGVRVVAEE